MMDQEWTEFSSRMEKCLAQGGNDAYVRQCWDALNTRMHEENKEAAGALFPVHMGAFDDLRKNGHRITVNNQPASVLAATLAPQERLNLACSIGRKLIEAHSENAGGSIGIRCAIKQADYFPNCIAIGLGATLQYLHPGLPGKKIVVSCAYDTYNGNGDPLGKSLQALTPCFPWAEIRVNAAAKEQPKAAAAPVLPLDQMATLFKAESIFKIALGRTGFAGTVLRGEIRKGDVLSVTDGRGQQIAPQGVVMNLALKDRMEDGKPVSETAETVTKGQHLDCLLLAVEIPQGSYNGLLLCGKGKTAQAEKPAQEKKPAEVKPAGERAPAAEKKGFWSGLFGKKKG